jgi:hypothetical protein
MNILLKLYVLKLLDVMKISYRPAAGRAGEFLDTHHIQITAVRQNPAFLLKLLFFLALGNMPFFAPSILQQHQSSSILSTSSSSGDCRTAGLRTSRVKSAMEPCEVDLHWFYLT